MPQVVVRDMTGERVGEIEVSERVFGVPLNPDLVHQALCVVEGRRHVGRHRTLSRAEVDLSKSKWYRQKGLGRARHGSRSAAQFVGGYKAMGPSGHKHVPRMPKKMARKALLSVLSEQLRDGVVSVVEGFQLPAVSTKAMAEALKALGATGRVLLLLSPQEYRDETLYLSCRNLPGLLRREVPHFSVRDVLWASHLLITKAALEALEALAVEG